MGRTTNSSQIHQRFKGSPSSSSSASTLRCSPYPFRRSLTGKMELYLNSSSSLNNSSNNSRINNNNSSLNSSSNLHLVSSSSSSNLNSSSNLPQDSSNSRLPQDSHREPTRLL